jgi:LmbE family N-acetylglucosaminyl deacetylase
MLSAKRGRPLSGSLKKFKPRRRRALTIAGSVLAASLLPSALFQFVLYRQNLAVARENFAPAPSIKASDRVLVVSPHCDDETLGAGGTMAAARKLGAAVRVVFLTNGDGSRSTQMVAQAQEFEHEIKALAHPAGWRTLLSARRGPRSNQSNLFQNIATMRQREALRACQTLGVNGNNVTFLGYPDGGLRTMWEQNWSPSQPYFSRYTRTSQSPYTNSFTPHAKYSGAQVVADLEKIMRTYKPTVVLTTHPEDTHPDHWSAYSYTNAALEALRLSSDKPMAAMARRARLQTFLVHHGIWPAPHGYQPNAELAPPASLEKTGTHWMFEPLSVVNRDSKKAALECYASQLVWTPHYLRSFIRKNELFGQVPPTQMDSALSTQHSALLVQDASCDSLWRERWPAADILDIRAEVAESSLHLHVDLGRAPSPRVRYRIALHCTDGKSTRVFNIEARPAGNELEATMSLLDSTSAKPETIAGNFTTSGFAIDIPLEKLKVKSTSEAAMLISANTHAGRARLDQTATAILRLN